MIDENTVAVVAASCRAGTFSALTRDEHTDLVRSIILAYEAAKPSPPMSTSGEMVERARWLAAGQDDPHSVTIAELCARIEALEALVAEADAENTLTESLLADERRARFAAEAALAKGGG